MSDKRLKDYNVRAVERAVQILSSLDDEHPERSLSDIAQATGLHKATAHRIVMTLLNGGFIERTAGGEKYRLGLRVAGLGLGVLHRLDFRREALPHMQQLVERFQEICTLGVFDRGQVLYVEIVHSKHTLTIAARVGRHLPAHCTASGKVLLAFLPSEVVEPMLNAPLVAYTEKTITLPARLREELEVVRQRGYALDDEEFEVGIRAVAAPIRDIDGNVIAEMSMPGPTSRLTPERIPEIAQALVEAASAVSAHGLARMTTDQWAV
ncbi:MAG: IclR family transcriptional regulator [Anaerolineales bacterium]|nr:MAG: IclR family transcriptional regulator [Anaerolineales bacterium]